MSGSKLFVGNLDFSVTEEEVRTLFGNYGTVQEVSIIPGRGFGFVEMAESEAAQQAKEALNETEFHGRNLRVDEAHPPKKRYSRDDYGDSYNRGGDRRGGFGGGRGGSRDNRGGSRDNRGGSGGGRRQRY